MMAYMKWRQSIATVVLCGVLAMPSSARAAVEEEDIKNDARTEGYPGRVKVVNASVALVWLAFLTLSVMSMAAIFKDAKRTHLD